MGDRYHLKLNCAYCGKLNPKEKPDSEMWEDDYVYYAPSSGFESFKCDFCEEENKIIEDFKAIKRS